MNQYVLRQLKAKVRQMEVIAAAINELVEVLDNEPSSDKPAE